MNPSLLIIIQFIFAVKEKNSFKDEVYSVYMNFNQHQGIYIYKVFEKHPSIFFISSSLKFKNFPIIGVPFKHTK